MHSSSICSRQLIGPFRTGRVNVVLGNITVSEYGVGTYAGVLLGPLVVLQSSSSEATGVRVFSLLVTPLTTALNRRVVRRKAPPSVPWMLAFVCPSYSASWHPS